MRAHRLLMLVVIAGAGGLVIERPASGESQVKDASRGTARLPDEGALPSLEGATLWLHTPRPLTAETTRGKVVLVQFGTYTCTNWRRTLPHVRAWAARYAGKGLVVVDVHTPEFEFERNLDNVRRAVEDIGLDVPIAVDSDRAIWKAFDNEYWPALYLADAKGRIRYHHFGEGDYERAERVIQQLLAEAGHPEAGGPLVTVDGHGAEAAASADLDSPETYLGYERAESFVAHGGARPNQSHRYAAPEHLGRNEWALDGDWTLGAQGAAADKPAGRIAYRFHARDVHLIMGPAKQGASVRFRVRIDGRPPGPAHGLDVDDQGDGTVAFPRTYQLIRQPGPIVDRTVEIEFLDPGVEAFDFTFG